MARNGVTYQDVAKAANIISQSGKAPTIEQVRGILGTGSSTTLARHLRAWKTKAASAAEVSERAELPMEIVGNLSSEFPLTKYPSLTV